MSIVKLGNSEPKKPLGHTDQGIRRIIHSIGSANYLKIEDTNTIAFQSAMTAEDYKEITI